MIWLLRHGEAEDGSPDADRALTPHGEQQARAAGIALAALGAQVDACLSSPKVRARETARLACSALAVEVEVERKLAGGPLDLDEIVAGRDSVLLVGHDPDFSMAVHSATGAQVRMKKGGLAAIDRGELKVMLRPREIEAIARD